MEERSTVLITGPEDLPRKGMRSKGCGQTEGRREGRKGKGRREEKKERERESNKPKVTC